MRSLFLKIFLWFWATMLVVGGSMVAIYSMQRDIFVNRWRASMEEALSLYAGTAAQEFDHYGLNGLNGYLERLEKSSGVHGSLMDTSGMGVSGRSSHVPKPLVDRALSSGKPEFASASGNDYGVLRAEGPSGKTYLFVVRIQRGSPGQFLNRKTLVLRWVLALCLSGLICYLLTRYLTRPIMNLRAAARKLAAGDLSARAGPAMGGRRDEIGELVQDFDQMAERIEGLLGNQRQLISDISHELRSPLARLNVALGLARQRAGADAAAPLDRIEREADRLNELIGKLLSLARMQAASSLPERVPVDLHDLLGKIAEDAEFEAQEQGCSVRLTEATVYGSGMQYSFAQAACVMGSAELLHSAVENVVRNAIRYTAPGTTVEIALSCRDGWATIDVRDCGPGVPDAELKNLFLPFYRVAGARDRRTGGAGLGLAIADRVARLHGGIIDAENLPGGKGFQVEIRLPLSTEGGSIPIVLGRLSTQVIQ
jgi:two-component system sensor histidine kinase CpxA